MRWRTTLILALLFAGAAGFYYLYEIRMAPEREKIAAQKGRLFEAEVKDVEAVAMKRKEGSLRLRREGDGWLIVEPISAKADKEPVESMVASLVTAKVEREVDPNPSKLSDFGLESPVVELTISVKGKSDPLTLLLGERSPTRSWVYGKTKEKPAVVLLSDTVLRDAAKKVDELRDKTILSLDRSAVTGLEVKSRGVELSAEAGGASEWRMVKPRHLPADRDRIVDLIDKVQFTKVKEFVTDSAKSLTQYGLDQPTEVTFWTGKEKDRTAKTLLIGALDSKKKGVYAKRAGEPSVFLVEEEIWKLIPKSVTELREKNLIALNRDKVEQIALESPKGRVLLVKEGGQWVIREPEKLKADETEVNKLLSTAQGLKAEEFIGEDAAAVSRVLAKPELRLAFTEQGAPAPKVLLLAQARDRGKAYAGLAGQGPLALVTSSALSDLAKSPTDLRDRSLLGFFDHRDVKKIQLKTGGQLILIERKGEEEWRLVEPKKGAARASKITELLWNLRTAKWSEIVSPNGEDPARFGLDAPTSEISLWKADGSEIGTLIVGRKEKATTYLRTKASPAIYAVDAKILGGLPKSPDDLSG
ncbi:MAG TPA: DUF4340 domain-containing protein [Methylomirabilota bacterium]|nr:DUF4340 domain-containing protein [Methylomirabilota bacterium]